MGIAHFILGLYALATLAALVGIIYLIIRRRRVRKGENFERRKN
jgi:hypothetical protein